MEPPFFSLPSYFSAAANCLQVVQMDIKNDDLLLHYFLHHRVVVIIWEKAAKL